MARYSTIAGKAISFFLVISSCLPLVAQTILEENRNKVVLKWAPVPLFDFYNTLQLGVEIPFPDPRFSFQQELGYGHSSFNIWYAEREDMPDRHSFRSRSQLRYYLREWNSFRIYFAGEYFIRNSRTYARSYIGGNCEHGCDYYKETPHATARLAKAVHLKFGFQSWLSPRICMDVYAGPGFRSIRSKSFTTNVPDYYDDGPWWENSNTRAGQPIPSFAMGFQLGIRLGKIKSSDR